MKLDQYSFDLFPGDGMKSARYALKPCYFGQNSVLRVVVRYVVWALNPSHGERSKEYLSSFTLGKYSLNFIFLLTLSVSWLNETSKLNILTKIFFWGN